MLNVHCLLKQNDQLLLIILLGSWGGFAKETHDFLMNSSHGINVDVVYSLNFR